MDGDFAMKGCGFCSHHQWEFLKNSVKIDVSSTLSTAAQLFPGALKKSIACIRLGQQVTIPAPYSNPLRILANLLPLTLGICLPGMRLASRTSSGISPIFCLMGKSGPCPRNLGGSLRGPCPSATSPILSVVAVAINHFLPLRHFI